MPLPPEELIAINDLLIEREGVFADIGRIEDAISSVLGQPYPIEPPKVLVPSTVRKKVKKAPKTVDKKVPIKLRALEGEEIAYRVYYKDRDTESHEDFLNVSAVLRLIENPLPELQVSRVTTLQRDLEEIETLFERA